MIRDVMAHRRRCDHERDEDLKRMTAQDSIAIGEALLTSEIMRLAEFPDDDRPQSLAIALGIRPRASGT